MIYLTFYNSSILNRTPIESLHEYHHFFTKLSIINSIPALLVLSRGPGVSCVVCDELEINWNTPFTSPLTLAVNTYKIIYHNILSERVLGFYTKRNIKMNLGNVYQR